MSSMGALLHKQAKGGTVQRSPHLLSTARAPTPAGTRSIADKRCSRQTAARATQSEQSQSTADPVVQAANKVGLPTEEGLFGFKPFAEVWVGRSAMIGFLCGLVGEYLTGKGVLQQVGLFTPNPALLATIIFVTGGATIFAAGRTLSRAETGSLTAAELVRYRQFLGLQKEQQNIAEDEERLKRGLATGTDVVSPDNYATIAAAKAEGTPADAVLGASDAPGPQGNRPESAWVRDASGPNQSLAAKADVLEQQWFSGSEWDFARNIEVQNGRWAMLGFWGAIVVEAATGQGIIGQVVGYLKAAGLLGQASGF